MTLFCHELRRGRTGLAIWTAAIASLLMVCLALFPEIKEEMEAVSEAFAAMGSFTAAFGMDRLRMGSLTGFYAIECGNILGLGGALFAALTGITALSGEEGGRTAEFLLTHPISRTRVITEKLASVGVRILALNGTVLALSLLTMTVIGEEIPWKEVLLLHLAYFLLQLEIGGICAGISAFLCRGGVGIGLGLAVILYCLNLIGNLTDRGAFLKYITPFGYCEGADIVTNGSLDGAMVLLGMGYMAAAVFAGYWKYRKKDIAP